MSQINHEPESNYPFSISLFIEVAQNFFPQNELCEDNIKIALSSSSEENNQYLQQLNLDSEDISSKLDDKSEEQQCTFHSTNSNIMKNILKSFQRFVENEKDPHLQQQYCKLVNVQYNYQQICKTLKFSLKRNGKRWNMKAKNIIETSVLKPLFCYYLDNIDHLWLENSKVTNKDEHISSIKFLQNQIKNPNQSEQIKYYQKKKSIIKKLY